jgi:hypothetical protein
MAAIQQNDSAAAESFIADKLPLSPKKRIQIYQEAYQIRMSESLKDDFHRVLEFVGEEEFEDFIFEYLQYHPSRYANLAEFSQNFPYFMKSKSAHLFQLATLDWQEILCEQAPEYPTEKIVSLEEVQQGTSFLLIRNPSVQVFLSSAVAYVTYRLQGSVISEELATDAAKVLLALTEPKDLESLTDLMLSQKIEMQQASGLMMSWMKNEILICARVGL